MTSGEVIWSVVFVRVVPLIRGGSSSSTVISTSGAEVALTVVLVPLSVDVVGLEVVLEVLGRAFGMSVSRISRITSGDPAALASVPVEEMAHIRSCIHKMDLFTCKNVKVQIFRAVKVCFTPLAEGDRSRSDIGP